MPGLIEWRRVIDWRLTQIARMSNVTLLPGNAMTADDVRESGYAHSVVATGATWRRDGMGRTLHRPIPGSDGPHIFTPDDIMDGRLPSGRVVLYDDDHYYMCGVLAELLARHGCHVTLCTPAPMFSYWSPFTPEQEKIQRRLSDLSVVIQLRSKLSSIHPGEAMLADTRTERMTAVAYDVVVLVADRQPRDTLATELAPARSAGAIQTVRVIGEAEAPNYRPGGVRRPPGGA